MIKAKAVIHGEVVLSSGQRADWYIDLRRVLLDGRAAPLAGRVMLEATADLTYDAVGGLTLGADPVATAMMHAAAAQGRPLDAFVVRKAEKAHGLQRRIEGPDVAGLRVLAVEDTSTTGNSVLTAVDALLEGRRRGGGCGRRRGARGAAADHRARPAVPRGLRTGRPRPELTRLPRAHARTWPVYPDPTWATTRVRSGGRLCAPRYWGQYRG